MTKRLVGLQLARAMAALVVVLSHAVAHPFPGATGWTHLFGRLAVTLFFVISGYIMTSVTGEGSFDPRRFLKKRIMRVVPTYYIATLLAAFGALVIPSAFKDSPFNIVHIAESLAFFPVFAPGSNVEVSPFLRLGWTLNYEMSFYLLFAALFMVSALTRAMAITIIFVSLACLGKLVEQTTAPGLFYTQMDTLAFAAGIWLALLGQNLSEGAVARRATILSILSIGSLLVIVSNYSVLNTLWITELWVIAVSVSILAILLTLEKVLEHRAPDWSILLGDASYSIYLFHMFAIGAVYKFGWHFVSRDHVWILIIAAFIGGTMIGVCAYKFIEVPVLRWIRGVFDKPQANSRYKAMPAE